MLYYFPEVLKDQDMITTVSLTTTTRNHKTEAVDTTNTVVNMVRMVVEGIGEGVAILEGEGATPEIIRDHIKMKDILGRDATQKVEGIAKV